MQHEESFVGSPIHWLRYALSDLELACAKPSHVLLEMLCFHAQQAVGKAVKAVLLAQGVEFPKTHNLRVLFDLLAEQIDIPFFNPSIQTPHFPVATFADALVDNQFLAL